MTTASGRCEDLNVSTPGANTNAGRASSDAELYAVSGPPRIQLVVTYDLPGPVSCRFFRQPGGPKGTVKSL